MKPSLPTRLGGAPPDRAGALRRGVGRWDWSRFRERVERIAPKLLWLLPLLVAILFFPLRGVRMTPDGSLYLARALNLYNKVGYVECDWSPAVPRGPVFPLLVAGSFHLFGVSARSALWVVRTAFVVNALLMYGIGAKLYNRVVGLSAAALYLTSYVIFRWSAQVLLDAVMPMFVFASFFLLLVTWQHRWRVPFFGMAGLLTGIAYLTKQTAILFLPLPALLWVLSPQYRRKGVWLGIVAFWVAALALIVPWMVYVSSVRQRLVSLISARS